MTKEEKKLIKLLKNNGSDLDLINMVHLIFMSSSQKSKIINYLNLMNSARIDITDEELANYIEEVLAY